MIVMMMTMTFIIRWKIVKKIIMAITMKKQLK